MCYHLSEVIGTLALLDRQFYFKFFFAISPLTAYPKPFALGFRCDFDWHRVAAIRAFNLFYSPSPPKSSRFLQALFAIVLLVLLELALSGT